ncbi:MAG: D-alanyl-D-alanine carboxypeptidase/D-alanyl-D-alanine-endopeptidase [Bacteroidetes bacterium]|nr:D-alanyl-D-alanine carboxypeptidase/D-alanyl-D-alanine-endopeptidase [Bacteroidota bacterium]
MRILIILLLNLCLWNELSLAQTALDSILDARPYAWWGAMVTDLQSEDTLYMRNADLSFMPASVTKLYTTSAALDQLGPDYKYVTHFYSDGLQTGRILDGNLIIKGAGDPSTGAPGPEWMNIFNAISDSLIAQGIYEIRGDIIGDDNVFDDVPLGSDWSWEDLTFGYAPQINGLTFHDAIVEIEARPTRLGQRAELTIIPQIPDYLTIDNQTLTIASGQSLVEGHTRIPESNQITVSSQVPLGRSDPEELTVHNPTLYFLHALNHILKSKDIHVNGQLLDIDDLPDDYIYSTDRLIGSHTSLPISELIATVNKDSHNLYAEHLLKTLGYEHPDLDEDDEIGSASMGVSASMRTYAKAGINTDRIQLVDGSGLSRKNLVSPAMTIRLLHFMASHPDHHVREAFISSLAIGGQDGTLEHQFIGNSPAHGKVRAKTGTLGNVSSLAGYITRDDGTHLAFVIFCNHFQGRHSAIRAIQESFVNSLVTYHITEKSN